MEKFSTWRDPGTGIHPFLPYKPPRTNESFSRTLFEVTKHFIVGPIHAIGRGLCIFVVLVLTFLLESLGYIFIFPSLTKAWTRMVYFVFLRLVLLLFGFHFITENKIISTRKGIKGSSRFPLPGKKGSIQGPTAIISNHVSYVDVVYYAWRHAPVFLHISKTGRVRPVSFWECLWNAGTYPSLDERDCVPLDQFLTGLSPSSSVVLFPEGTTSNGKALLEFLPVISDALLPSTSSDKKSRSQIQFQIKGLKYAADEFSPSYTAGSRLLHLYWLLAQYTNHLEVRSIRQEDVDANLETWKNTVSDEGALSLSETVANMLAQVLRQRRTKLNAGHKQDFLEYFEERARGKKYK